jgi:hypothetical protein
MAQGKIPISRTQEIVNTVNQLGLVKGAIELGIPQSTLCVFLRRQGFRLKKQYVRAAKPTDRREPTLQPT